MIHPKTEVRYINEDMGYGVVAKEFIPKGTIIWVQDQLDREMTPAEVQALEKEHREILEVYTFRNSKGNYILCWDNGKYINHSFNSNCFTTPYEFEIAIRDIEAGEQLTDDYGYLNLVEPFSGIDEGTPRKVVYPNDLLTYHSVWDEKVGSAFVLIPDLDQPLKRFLPRGMWDKIDRITRGEEELDSLLICYCGDTVREERLQVCG